MGYNNRYILVIVINTRNAAEIRPSIKSITLPPKELSRAVQLEPEFHKDTNNKRSFEIKDGYYVLQRTVTNTNFKFIQTNQVIIANTFLG